MGSYHQSRLKLEVELPPVGLKNYIKNPSGSFNGAASGFGWITPVAFTELFGSPNDGGFTLYNNNDEFTVPVYFTSEKIRVTAGQYLSARAEVISVDLYYRVRYEWLNSAEAVISTTVMTAYINTTGVVFFGTQIAPAGASYMRLRFDIYNTSSGGNPYSTDIFTFKNAMVTKSATGTPTVTRLNLLGNPSFENNLTGWETLSYSGSTSTENGVLTRVGGFSGSSAFVGQLAAGVGRTGPYGQRMVQTHFTLDEFGADAGGRPHIFSARLFAAGGTTGFIQAVYRNASNVDIGYAVANFVQPSAAWHRHTLVAPPAPAGAVNCDLTIYFSNIPIGQFGYIDDVIGENASTFLGYFDGSYADTSTYNYSWLGTAGNSRSTQQTLAGFFEYAAPTQWADILDKLSAKESIRIKREPLNAGFMKLVLTNNALDPAVSNALHSGKRVRLLAYDDDNAIYEQLFEGKIFSSAGTYAIHHHAPNDTEDTVRIDVLVVDPNAELTQEPEPRGTGAVLDLIELLEGKGYPWKVNGITNQFYSLPTWTVNDGDASILDQIMLTRDTKSAYAWVSKESVVTVQEEAYFDNTVYATFSDDNDVNKLGYEAIDATFVTDECINIINIKYLYLDAGETVEAAYGPFRLEDSIEQFGPNSKDITITGTLAEATAKINALVVNVFAKNGTPTTRCKKLVFSADYKKAYQQAIRRDFYDIVKVEYRDRLDANLRIVSIEHDINAVTWDIAFGFGSVDSIASIRNTSGGNSSSGGVSGGSYEPIVAFGTTSQWYRGDKTWQSITPSVVGLGNVVNLAQVDLVNNQTIGGIKHFTNRIRVSQIGTPGSSPAGTNEIYFKADRKPYYMNESGVEVAFNVGDVFEALHANPDFEIVTTPPYPDSWSGFWQTGGSTAVTDSSDVFSNSKSVTMTNPAAGNSLFYQSSVQSCSPGDTIDISAVARKVSGTPSFTIGIQTKASGTPDVLDPDTTSLHVTYSPSGIFTRYVHSAVVPAGHTVWRMFVQTIAGGVTGSVLRVDHTTSKRTPGSVLDTGWINMILINSWANFDAAGATQRTAQYRKIGNMVYLRGVIKTGTSGTVFWAAPSGFRMPVRAANEGAWVVPASGGFGQVLQDASTGNTAMVNAGGGSNVSVFSYLTGVFYLVD